MVGVTLAIAAPFVLIALVFGAAAVLGRRSVKRENKRRQAIYQEECEEARRLGLPPPVPPNVARWG